MTDQEFAAELTRRLATEEGSELAKRIVASEPVRYCPDGCGARISESYHWAGYRCDDCADNAECQGMLYEGMRGWNGGRWEF